MTAWASPWPMTTCSRGQGDARRPEPLSLDGPRAAARVARRGDRAQPANGSPDYIRVARPRPEPADPHRRRRPYTVGRMDHVRLGNTGLLVSEALPRDHDLRAAVRRGHVRRHHGSGRRGWHHLLRHGRRLPAGRRAAHRGPDRGDRRQLAARASGTVRGGDQVRRAHGPGRLGAGQLAQAHPGRRRGLAAATGHRLHRSLPAPRARPRHADRRDAGRPRRPRPCGQGPLRRLLQLPGLPGGPGARPERGARPGALRLGAAPLQPAVPPDRARAAPTVRRGGARGHSLQPDRRRPAVGKAQPLGAPDRRHPLHAGQRRRQLSGPLLARPGSSPRWRSCARSPSGRASRW